MPRTGVTMVTLYEGNIRIEWINPGGGVINPEIWLETPGGPTLLDSSPSTITTGHYDAGVYPAGTTVRTSIRDHSSVVIAYSDSLEAQYRDGYVDGLEWVIDWEDTPGGDYDYNDAYTRVVLTDIVYPTFVPQIIRHH